jgi:hypothetical protein
MHKYIEVSSEESIVGKNGKNQVDLDRKNLLNEKGLYRGFYKYFNEFSFFQRQEDAFNYKAPIINAKKTKKINHITDITGYSPLIMAFPWLISEKMYKVMSQFNVGKHKLFEVNIEDTEEKYYFMHKYNIKKEELIIDKCIVTTGTIKDNKEYMFNNYQEFVDFSNKNVLYEFKTVAIDKSYEIEDIIFTQSAGNYFSERLIQAIEEKGFRGLRVHNNRCEIKFV